MYAHWSSFQNIKNFEDGYKILRIACHSKNILIILSNNYHKLLHIRMLISTPTIHREKESVSSSSKKRITNFVLFCSFDRMNLPGNFITSCFTYLFCHNYLLLIHFSFYSNLQLPKNTNMYICMYIFCRSTHIIYISLVIFCLAKMSTQQWRLCHTHLTHHTTHHTNRFVRDETSG